MATYCIAGILMICTLLAIRYTWHNFSSGNHCCSGCGVCKSKESSVISKGGCTGSRYSK